MNIRDRYRSDPMINIMVNQLVSTIEQLSLTPTEVRECAMLACVIYEQSKCREFMYGSTDIKGTE